MQTRRVMPLGFAENSIRMSQDQLCKKYRAGSRTVQRWRKELETTNKMKKGIIFCQFREHIDCGDHSSCGKCGWNPEEHERIIALYVDKGMDAVREYISERGRGSHEDNS